jgi:hypothetical protein
VLRVVAGVVFLGVVAGAAVVVVRGGGGPSHPDEWDERVVDIADFVERERGLEFEHPVALDFLTSDEYADRTRVDQGDLTDEDRELFEDGAAPLRALGLVPADADLLESTNDLADTGTLAFYDPVADRISVRGTELSVDVRVTLAHELVHVLQDQHFDLGAAWDDPETTSERFAGFTALLEGDAIRIENAYIDALDADELDNYFDTSGELADEAEAGLDDVPGVLVARELAPYALGPSLVDLIAADGGNAAVDDAFEDPPASTEHMVDPRAYFGGDGAHHIAAPDVPDGAEPVGEEDSLGALTLFLLLSERIDRLEALTAADGWGGDAFMAYDDDGRTCVDLAVEGDTAADDDEIQRALEAWAAAGPDDAASVDAGGAGATVLTSCTPEEGADGGEDPAPGDRALDALTVPAVRAQIMWASSAGDLEVDAAFAAGDCFVRAVPLATLVEANESPDPSEDVTAAIDQAMLDCLGPS